MTYLESDVAHFVNRAPYLALARPASAVAFLERALRLHAQCFTGLHAYPAVRVEPLEFFYVTVRSLGMLDVTSLAMMTTQLTWRGVVWGGWLASLRPVAAFEPVLEHTVVDQPDNLLWVRCALAVLQGRPPPPSLARVAELAAAVREVLATVPIERVPLRSQPTPDEVPALERERRLVREVYRRSGVEPALRALRGTRLHELTLPYPQWRARRATDRG